MAGADVVPLPLDDWHVAMGARMVPFAGYSMPLHYAPGILKEHLHTRARAGLFDVSHMGAVRIAPNGTSLDEVRAGLETLVPADILGLPLHRQRYSQLLNEAGGVIDDLMISNLGDHLFVVVNAANKQKDLAHLKRHLGALARVDLLEGRALLAIQGPQAAAALAQLVPAVAALRFMDCRLLDYDGEELVVSRSGYTGEDGFEILLPATIAAGFAGRLVAIDGVRPIGLGARDSLRLEAGLCLHGNDLDETISPVEAGLDWSIQKVRRSGGARAGGFPGAHRVLNELDHGPTRCRVGLRPEGRAPVRGGAPLFATPDGGDPVGVVSSGGFGPSVEAPVAMGFVPAAMSAADTRLYAEVRGQRLAVVVRPLPFIAPGYQR